MTLGEFQKYLLQQNCESAPLEGGNLTGIGLVLKNKSLNRTYIFQIYIGGDPSDRSITKACDMLGIKYPPHLRED
jgi:hypothetical protein